MAQTFSSAEQAAKILGLHSAVLVTPRRFEGLRGLCDHVVYALDGWWLAGNVEEVMLTWQSLLIGQPRLVVELPEDLR